MSMHTNTPADQEPIVLSIERKFSRLSSAYTGTSRTRQDEQELSRFAPATPQASNRDKLTCRTEAKAPENLRLAYEPGHN
jgi:hypothetical protein